MGLIPPSFLDCVVSIGVKGSEGIHWVASGFLYGHYLRTLEDGITAEFKTYLVTNRHVFENLETVIVRFNPKTNEPAREYTINLKTQEGNPLWINHPNSKIDIAILPINYSLIQDMQVSFFESDAHVANIKKLNELGIIEGDFVYVLGFPMGIVGAQRNMVIVRSGIVARIRDALAKDNEKYLIDASVFPGNSGGPVILKPELTAIKGTKPQDRAYLIGVIISYVPYRDVAYSMQTKRPRITFEENSGLAEVHPIDFVEETVAEHLKLLSTEQQ
ncbi:MAG: S1-C subfamily serine protease [Candidatus Nitrosomirales archaeon]|jgi:S1-C subfamily serine protease